MGIQIRAAKKALIQNVAYGPWMLLEGAGRKFLEEGAFGFLFARSVVFLLKMFGGGEALPCPPLY